ncbi:class I SAM-dependent methyltransferase [Clostridium butyricum]|uniref:Methyltransferase family protein n=2 Tax=Clostridium butyricum TaxID=1492 RepID=C4IDM8_CLOBU|nr:class I SAM-dependent methyltransferase [Clostridium butyricum]APF22004.1 methyltransferase small domain protein [Clostridium butyricum]EDT75326.1 methyltransferase domain family [Clostridium butyricum 5521]EEP55673.1 methyltransferase family protein [Clostridium butyricum E4 str. BoNT E BL5262]KHD15796.1 methyltransferase [Clostridium butyricum]NFL31536.1 class I SAM-dependent methyltransferase [Clostridium butyricum]
MKNLTDKFWKISGKVSDSDDDFGIGVFGDGIKEEIGYRHYHETKKILKLIKPKKSMNIIELGCGSGRFCKELSPFINRYVGIDYSPKAIELAKEMVIRNNIKNAEFKVASAIDFELDESVKFDVVYFGCVLQYISDDDIKRTFNNLKKYMNSDTIIIERDSTYNRTRYLSDSIIYKCTYRTRKEIEVIFYDCIGYKLCRVEKSYRFLKGNDIFKYNKNIIKRFKKYSYEIMNIISLLYDKFIYNSEEGNYNSHDFFLFKKQN